MGHLVVSVRKRTSNAALVLSSNFLNSSIAAASPGMELFCPARFVCRANSRMTLPPMPFANDSQALMLWEACTRIITPGKNCFKFVSLLAARHYVGLSLGLGNAKHILRSVIMMFSCSEKTALRTCLA
jgi:hypothetical protein